jgi:hypothetical protein
MQGGQREPRSVMRTRFFGGPLHDRFLTATSVFRWACGDVVEGGQIGGNAPRTP